MSVTKDEIHKLCIEEASKSTAKKRKVGAILTKKNSFDFYEVLASGHNYNPDNSGFCEDNNGNTFESVIHAEIACINNFKLDGRYSIDGLALLLGLHMFVTFEPCPSCLAALKNYSITYEVVGEFMKFDKTKLRMSLVPASLAQSCARALQYGAKKYKVDNWRKTPDIESYISAMQRHFDAWREGEENDSESGLNHLDHMAANLAFLIELKHLPKIKDESIKL